MTVTGTQPATPKPLTKPPPHCCAEDACHATSTLAQSAVVVQPRMKSAQARFTYKP